MENEQTYTVVIKNPKQPIGLGSTAFGGKIIAAYDRELKDCEFKMLSIGEVESCWEFGSQKSAMDRRWVFANAIINKFLQKNAI